jgi:hypothetical protein
VLKCYAVFYVVVSCFFRRAILFSDVFCSAFVNDIGEVFSISIFLLALLACQALGYLCGCVMWTMARWWRFCSLFVTSPAIELGLFALFSLYLCESRGVWMTLGVTLLTFDMTYHHGEFVSCV